MADQLTDLPGIGDKTAASLREDGISDPDDLADAYLRNSPKVRSAGKRIERAAREAAFDREGSFTDPASGATVSEENRTAFEQLASRRVSDFNSISVSAAKSSVSPDDQIRDFIGDVKQGTFFTKTGGDSSLMAFAADAADNLGADTLSSGELQDLNSAGRTAGREVTLRKQSSTGTTTPVGDVSLGPFFQANVVHDDRSAMAQRVDENRDAPVTEDVDKWRANSDEYDFQGVDTPQSGADLFPETRTKRKRGGFGSSERPNRDREQMKSAFETFASLSDDGQERLFGESFDYDLSGPFGQDSDGSDSGGFEELL